MVSNRITAIVKPTHECNLACKYCYVEEGAEQGRMSSKTLENFIEQMLSIPGKDNVHFIWHGGEPLLMGLDFYREAVNIQNRLNKNKKIDNCMQSNATLIDDKVLDFCEEYNFDIGSSLDGPEEIHNLTRVYSDGRGSFKDVWKGLQMLKQRNAELRKRAKEGEHPKYLGGGAITILTSKNIGRINEVYDFFKTNKMSIKINPLIKSGKAKNNFEELSIGPKEYGKSLVKLFDSWFYEKEKGIDVDPLSSILGNLMTGKPVNCNFGESCRNSFISVGPLGDVYPCGRFDGVKEYWLGNVNETSMDKMINSKSHLSMSKRKVEECSPCKYNKICNSGCMHNAYMKKGSIQDKDYYCASYKILFEHLDKALNLELEKARVA